MMRTYPSILSWSPVSPWYGFNPLPEEFTSSGNLWTETDLFSSLLELESTVEIESSAAEPVEADPIEVVGQLRTQHL